MLGKSHCESVAPSRRNRRFATPHGFFFIIKLYSFHALRVRRYSNAIPIRYHCWYNTVPDVMLRSQILYYLLPWYQARVHKLYTVSPERYTVCIARRTIGDRYFSILLELYILRPTLQSHLVWCWLIVSVNRTSLFDKIWTVYVV